MDEVLSYDLMWDLDTSNTRAGNSKQVETILNDALKGHAVFDSNHASDQRIVHFGHITKMVPDIKKQTFGEDLCLCGKFNTPLPKLPLTCPSKARDGRF